MGPRGGKADLRQREGVPGEMVMSVVTQAGQMPL